MSTRPHQRPATDTAAPKAPLFRFAFVIAVLLSSRLAIFIPPHLWFDSLRRPVAFAVSQWDISERLVTNAAGTLVVSLFTGQTPSVGRVIGKSNIDWFASAIPDLIGVLALALVIAALWTSVDHRRAHHESLNRWLRVYLRYGLAAAMFSYAFVKVIPTQFGPLTPGELLRPLGQMSRFQVLWTFMAVSPGYTIFTGLVELLGAVLLVFRRTTVVGAMVLAGALTNVVAMDIAYRVGALTYALSLLVLDLLIIEPYLKPLFEICLMRGCGRLCSEPRAVHQGWWNSPFAKSVLICGLAVPLVAINIQRRRSFLNSGHAVYGMFDVTTFIRNGQTITPLASDNNTWKRVASDPANGVDAIVVQFASGDLHRFELTDDRVHHVWTILDKDRREGGTLKYGLQVDGTVSLDGRLGGDSVDILLRPVDLNTAFPLLGSS